MTMASPPPPPAFTASRATVPVPTPAVTVPSFESSSCASSRIHSSWQPRQYPGHLSSNATYLAPIPSHLLPVSDLDSSDLDHLDSSDLDSDLGHDDHQLQERNALSPVPLASPRQAAYGAGKSLPPVSYHQDQDYGHKHEHQHQHACRTAGILSLEQVFGLNAGRSSTAAHHRQDQDQDHGHGRGVDDEQQEGGDDDPQASDINNLWAPPPTRKAALKARTAKTFADGDSADDDDGLDLDSCSDFDGNVSGSDSDSDFESNTKNVKYGKGKGPCTSQPHAHPRSRTRRSCGVSPSSSRPTSAPTRNIFSCHLSPAPPRATSPLHPHVHPSLNPLNNLVPAAVSPLPALARAILGPLAPLTLNIVAKFEATAEMERQEAVGGPRLASYEEMILEALLTREGAEEDGDEFDGLVPKDMYAYMTSRYPTAVPPNFRGSATQALKKAMKKGLLARHAVSSKYVVNPEYTGALALGRAKPNLMLSTGTGAAGSRPATSRKSRAKRQMPVAAAAAAADAESSSTDEDEDLVRDDHMNVDDEDHDLDAQEDIVMQIDRPSPPPSPTSTAGSFSSLSSLSFGDPRIWTPPPASPPPHSPDLHRLFTPSPSPSPSPMACPPPTPPQSSRPTTTASASASASGRQVPPPLDLTRAILTVHDSTATPIAVQVPAHGLPTPPTDQDKFVTARLAFALGSSPLASAAATAADGAARPHTPGLPPAWFSPRVFSPALGKELDWMGGEGGGAISPMWLTSPRKRVAEGSPAMAAAAAAAVEGGGAFARPPESPCMAGPAARRTRVQGELPAHVVVGGHGDSESPMMPPSVKRSLAREEDQGQDQHKRVRANPWMSPALSPTMSSVSRGPSLPPPVMPDTSQDCAFKVDLPPVVPMPGMLSGSATRPMTSPQLPAFSATTVPFTLSMPTATAVAAGAVPDSKQPIWLPLVPGRDGTWRIWTPEPPAPAPAIALKFESDVPTAASGAYAAVSTSVQVPPLAQEYEPVPEWARLRPVTCPAPPTATAPPPAHMWTQHLFEQQAVPGIGTVGPAEAESVFGSMALTSTPLEARAQGMHDDEGIGLDWLTSSCPASSREELSRPLLEQGGAMQGMGVDEAEAAAMFDALVVELAGGGESSAWII